MPPPRNRLPPCLPESSALCSFLESASLDQLLDTSLFKDGGGINSALRYEASGGSTGGSAQPPLFEAVVFTMLSKVCCHQYPHHTLR